MTRLNPFTRRLATVAAAVCVASVSSLALARGADCAMDGMHHGSHADRMHGSMGERMKERMAQHHADLKAKLQLTPQQEAAWTAYTTAMQPPAQMPKRPDPAELAKMTTPQRLEQMQALKAERDAHMTQRLDAIKAFYAQLTPEQQKVFDAEHAQRGHRGHGRQHG